MTLRIDRVHARVHARGAGRGTGRGPIVCLHAMMTDGRYFGARRDGSFAHALAAAGHDVLVADFRGHGRSVPPRAAAGDWSFDDLVEHDLPTILTTVAVTSQVATADIAIVGHSLGGLAALMLAADRPALLGKLMIVDALPFIGTIFGAADVASVTPRAEQMRAAVLARAGAVTPDFTPPADCPASLPPPDPIVGNMTNSGPGACHLKHGALASDLKVVAQAMYDDILTDMRPRLKQITAPVTVLYAQDDRLQKAAEVDALYTTAYTGTPRLTLHRVPGSYHFIMLDQPARFEKELDAFLAAR